MKTTKPFRFLLVGLVLMAVASMAAAQAGGPFLRPIPAGSMFGLSAGQYQFDNYLRMLADVNMSPDVTLDKAQKEKIAAVKDEFKKATEKFLADNTDEWDKIQQGSKDAGQDMQKWQELGKQSQELLAKGPKAQEYIDRIKAALTADQLKAVNEKARQIEEESKARMDQWRKSMQPDQLKRGGILVEPKE